MSTEVLPTSPATETLEELVQRTQSLYSLPAITAEVIELTRNPEVDVRALKDCIEVDPALTAKILRVVNSSLFGLSGEVSDLNQAIALLGTKPLKLLVLGFSLPENLFSKVARNQLEWFWTTTLSRAVAAREISENLWGRPGDDVFLAGLLQDIGVLMLLGQLQEPYAQFLTHVIDGHLDLQQVEVESMGFGHTELSAALLEHWKMPEQLVEAISERRDSQLLQQKETPAAEMARILHLAGLLAELVAQRRLGVLPELLEVGEVYCGLDKQMLNQIVESLQPKVEQLAEVLSLDLCDGNDYPSILVEAHAQMAQLTETLAEPMSRISTAESPTYEGVLEDATLLREAVHSFLNTSNAISEELSDSSNPLLESTAIPSSTVGEMPIAERKPLELRWFADKLTLAVGHCRSQRQALSIAVIEITTPREPDSREAQLIAQVFDAACRNIDHDDTTVEAISPTRRALILPDCERSEATHHSQTVLTAVEKASAKLEIAADFTIAAGAATVGLPSKNFLPMSLYETAQRCLTAAQSSETSVVKSLEVY